MTETQRISRGPASGFGLTELMVATALGALLLGSLLQIVMALSLGLRQQAEANALAERARFAWQTLRDHAESAGYAARPWLDGSAHVVSRVLSPGSEDAYTARGDRLSLETRSDRNCFGNPNPSTDPQGLPAFFILRTSFFVRDSGELVWVCEYGAEDSSLVRQVNHLSLLSGVESFQVQYAEDSDADGHADRWVRAGQWGEEIRLRGVRFSLLLASPAPLFEPRAETFMLLDESLSTPADGRLRRRFDGAVSFGGRNS